MRVTLGLAFLASLVLLPAGCRRPAPAISAAPTLAELPRFAELEPTLPIEVAVEGAYVVPRVVLVPKYEPIELTAEEREALGERVEPEVDLLAFYRPPRRPDQGVSTEVFTMAVGIGGVGGALVGRASVYERVNVHGEAGRYYASSLDDRAEASRGRARENVAGVGGAWTISVGEGRARQPAERAHSTYR
jgi:hypothetical protein